MGCETFKRPDGGVIVCGRSRRRPPERACFSRPCNGPVEKLCDFPLGNGKTCDRPCCKRHSKPVAGKDDTDYCLEHALKCRDEAGVVHPAGAPA